MSFKPKTLSPITKKPARFPIASFDIEGVGGLDGFLVGGTLTDDDYHLSYTPNELLEFMRKRKYASTRFFAHNLTYDFGLLFGYVTQDEYPTLLNGRVFKTRLISGKNHPRYLTDSLLFSAGMPLKTLGSIIGQDKIETPAELLSIPSYMSQETKQSLLKTPHLLDYLYRDCEIAKKYMELFQTTINDLGGEMKFTLASTAMDLFRRAYLKQEYYTPFEARNNFARKAYYGGRVEPMRLGAWDDVNVYDINSLYPYVMSTYEYPDPNFLHGPTWETDPSLIANYEGVSDVTIEIPETYIPPLPYRHLGRLFFPTGKFRGHYTHIEIRRAIELGAKLHDVHETLYSDKTCSPFVSYVNDLYALRQTYKASNDPRELVIKIMLNSLYGKFGQRSDSGLQKIKSLEWFFDGNQHVDCEFRQVGDIVWCLVGVASNFQPKYINTLWASYITSYARLTLLDYMLMADDALLYCDTDSIFINGSLETSKKLGGMKLEDEHIDIEIYGPKAYLKLIEDNVVEAKCKGVPYDHRLPFLLEGLTKFKRPIGLLEATRRKPKLDGSPYLPSEWIEVVKSAHDAAPKRVILPLPSSPEFQAMTRPHSIEEVLALRF